MVFIQLQIEQMLHPNSMLLEMRLQRLLLTHLSTQHPLSGGIDTTMRAMDTNTQTIAVTVDSVLPTALSISSITLATLTNAASSVTQLDGAVCTRRISSGTWCVK